MTSYPAPGRLVRVGDAELHVIVEGNGPAVLFDSGIGGSSIEWKRVAADLSSEFTVIRYDRPGFAWSPGSSCDRRSVAAARRIIELLKALEINDPVILVGHSMGGIHVRMFTHAYPDLVAGLVLVDSSHEQQAARFSQVFPGYTEMMFGYARRVRAWSGRTHEEILDHLWGSDLLPLCPSPEVESLMRDRMNPEQMVSIADEYESMFDVFNQPDEAIHSLGDLPTIALTSTRKFSGDDMSEAQSSEMFRIFQECQAEISQRSTRGRQILVAQAGHYIQVDQPQIVIDAVRAMVEIVRGVDTIGFC